MAFDWRGGNITTMSANGRLWEEGPNSFQPGDAWRRVAKFLGKTSQPFFGESPDSRSSCQKCLIYYIFYTSLGREVQLTRILIPLDWCVLKPPLVWTLLHVFFLHILFGGVSGERWAEPGVLGAGDGCGSTLVAKEDGPLWLSMR